MTGDKKKCIEERITIKKFSLKTIYRKEKNWNLGRTKTKKKRRIEHCFSKFMYTEGWWINQSIE